jgi:hypothetical protein
MGKSHAPFRAVLVALAAIAAGLASGGAEAQNAKKTTTGASTPAAGSAPNLITAASFDAIIEALEDKGFTVKLTADSDGDPLIESTADDAPFTVRFYGCTRNKDCEYIQFVSGWDLSDGVSLQVIEKWNEDRVWGRAFIDSDNDPWIDLAVNLKGGVTPENFNDTVSWWWAVMRDFEEHIGWNR